MAQTADKTTLARVRGPKPYKRLTKPNSSPVTNQAADSDGQDEHLWECAIANSLDTIRDLADQALADRQAGRTKKIPL